MARTTRASTRSASTALKATTPSKQNQKSAPKNKVKKEATGAENIAVKDEEGKDDDTPRSQAKGAKRTASAIDSRTTNGVKRQSKRVKKEEDDQREESASVSSSGGSYSDDDVQSSILETDEESLPSIDDEKPTNVKKNSNKKKGSTPAKQTPKKTAVKTESTPDSKPKAKTKTTPAKDLSSKKLDAYFKNVHQSPFPDFPHPTPSEAKLAHRILSSLHGARTRPEKVVASTERAGCGDSPSVLDALVRTILSQNTSDKNSTRAKKSMDAVYGGSDRWDEIVAGGQPKLQDAIKSGGLSVTKSKVILSILEQAYEKYGKYSLDHLFDASNEDAMREMLSFQGVGPKTASCVLLFCLQRESFAVDTHVHRITGLLGWRPKNASRDETHSHLDVMIPDEDKYGLHILLVKHGKVCEECKAGGKNLGKCELRRAFRQGKVKGEAGDDVKDEEIEKIKDEDGDESEWFGV